LWAKFLAATSWHHVISFADQGERLNDAAKHVATVDDDAAGTFRAMLKVDVWYAPVVTSDTDKTYRGVVGLDRFIKESSRIILTDW